MLNRKKIILLLTITLITVLLLISGCSTFIFGPSGSIKVTSNPSGAKIFLDGKDTGKITPYILKNVSVGSHIIEVTLSDMKGIKIAEVKAYQTTNINIEFYSQITLDKINVLPPITTISLSLGNTMTISSVTAYYSDYSSANIPLTDCTYSSNDACATVNSSGTITGISEGAAIITVSYTEEGITKTDTVLVNIRNTPTDTPVGPPFQDDIVYRALLVGVGDYENDDGVTLTDLNGPPYDVGRMHQVLGQCKFGSLDTEFSSIVELKDLSATKAAIIVGIASTFSGADDNDISYFYFSGHGTYTGDYEIFYICPTDVLITSLDNHISVDVLESALSSIPGTKIVILDSCYSGGFIGKGEGENNFNSDKLVDFNNNIINIFSMSQSKDPLTTNQYKVLTSCHDFQTCVGTEDLINPENSYGRFTMALCQGCGYDSFTSPYLADNNENNKVSLQEAYLYIESALELFEQDVQVYPADSTFTIVEY
jgi:hypothetical protein